MKPQIKITVRNFSESSYNEQRKAISWLKKHIADSLMENRKSVAKRFTGTYNP